SLRRSLSAAEPADRRVHGAAAGIAGQPHTAKPPPRDRPRSRRHRQVRGDEVCDDEGCDGQGRDFKGRSAVTGELPRRAVAEFLGTALLLAAVVGSGIMAQRLAGGNVAIALLCNTIPTGAILTVLILIFGPLSGAHFNPVVSAAFAFRRELAATDAALYAAAQVAGGIIGVWAAHLMFDLASLM